MRDPQLLSAWQRTGLWAGSAALFLTACQPLSEPSAQAEAHAALHTGHDEDDDVTATASTILRDAYGDEVARVRFTAVDHVTLVEISAELPESAADGGGIRGLHIHANDNPDNGSGCIADPAQPASTHFVSADGHFTAAGATHGHHVGDLPALFVNQEGQAWMRFTTDRFHPEEVIGRALILHAGPDNYGNIPVGDQPDQYTPNDPAATDLTARTGNAGTRYACGVIE
jgi:Cu-Zn family superoxide dismutase